MTKFYVISETDETTEVESATESMELARTEARDIALQHYRDADGDEVPEYEALIQRQYARGSAIFGDARLGGLVVRVTVAVEP